MRKNMVDGKYKNGLEMYVQIYSEVDNGLLRTSAFVHYIELWVFNINIVFIYDYNMCDTKPNI